MKLRTLSVSKETITSLYIAQGILQEAKGVKVTLSETLDFLINHWDPNIKHDVFQLEEKQ